MEEAYVERPWYLGGNYWAGYDPLHQPAEGDIIDGEAMWEIPYKYDIKDALDEIASKITVHV